MIALIRPLLFGAIALMAVTFVSPTVAHAQRWGPYWGPAGRYNGGYYRPYRYRGYYGPRYYAPYGYGYSYYRPPIYGYGYGAPYYYSRGPGVYIGARWWP